MIEEALDGLVDVEALRDARDLRADGAQLGNIDAGIAAARILDFAGGLEPRPAAVEPIGLVRLVARRNFELSFKVRAPAGLHLFDVVLGDDAFADQPLAVDFQRGRVRADFLVHQRLGERGLVAFVVAERR